MARTVPCLVLLATLLGWRPGAAQGRRAASLDELQAAARADSLDPLAHYGLGIGYLRERRFDEADASMRTAARLDPRMAVARLGIAVAQDRNERYWDSLRRAGGDSVVQAERERRDAELRRAFLLDPLADIRVLTFADRRRIDLPPDIATGDYSAAGYVLGQLEQRLMRRGRPRDSLPPGLLWSHALVSAHAGATPHAIVDLAALLRRMTSMERTDSASMVPLPTNEVRYLLAAVYQRAGARADAMLMYRQTAEHDLGNYMAQVQLARLHEAGEEWSQAIAARRAAINANPDDPTLQLDLAASFLNGRFPARAESLLLETEPALPRDPRLHYLLGRARQSQGKRDAALASLRLFMQLAPARWGPALTDARRRIDSMETAPRP